MGYESKTKAKKTKNVAKTPKITLSTLVNLSIKRELSKTGGKRGCVGATKEPSGTVTGALLNFSKFLNTCLC